ncbi:hypothetical protein ACFYO5_37820 [Streptomyces sp. NPDC006259]|uniref:hypothetical protein n=1 Tax=Streptomyces sp. NPDC006259 TaxID=3364740 RepID=UPI0036877C9A
MARASASDPSMRRRRRPCRVHKWTASAHRSCALCLVLSAAWPIDVQLAPLSRSTMTALSTTASVRRLSSSASRRVDPTSCVVRGLSGKSAITWQTTE